MADSYETRDGRKKHDARITYDVIDGYLAKMSGSACKVYLALCRHANWTTDETFVKIGTIAKLCGLSPGTVSKTLAELVGLALISRAERYRSDKSRTSDLITLLDPPPLEKDADPPHESDTHPGYEIGGDTNKHSLIQHPDTHSEVSADPSPSGDAVQPALIQTASDPVEKEADTRKELELVLIDHFVEASRIERPIRRVKADYKADQTRWRKPIQVIAGLVDWDTGESIRLLDATLERLLGGTMTVSSPLSLVETARSIKGEWARGQPVRTNGRQPQTMSVGGGQRWG